VLHLIIATHGPDTCPASRQDIRETFLGELGNLGQTAQALDATVVGSWNDMTGHTLYLVIDAPDAHTVQRLAANARLMDWGTVDVKPLVELSEAVARIAQREPLM